MSQLLQFIDWHLKQSGFSLLKDKGISFFVESLTLDGDCVRLLWKDVQFLHSGRAAAAGVVIVCLGG